MEGIPVEVVLDTGAEVSVVGMDMVISLGVPIKESPYTSVDGIGGTAERVMGAVDLNFFDPDNGVRWTDNCLVVSGAKGIYLSAELLRRIGAVLDFRDQSTELKFPQAGGDGLVAGTVANVTEGRGFDSMCSCTEEEKDLLMKVISDDLAHEGKVAMFQVLLEFVDLWRNPKLGRCKQGTFQIETTGAPVPARVRPLSVSDKQEVERQIAELLEAGAIRESTSSYASAIVMVQKSDGSRRMAIDFRPLNALTVGNSYPLPRIDELIGNLRGGKCFITLDLKWGYWQMAVHPDTVEKLAFITPGGLYEWLVAPFGPKTMPAIFQAAIDRTLAGLKKAQAYLDDIIVWGDDWEECLENGRAVLEVLRRDGWYLALKKCVFGTSEPIYLGLQATGEDVRLGTKRISALDKLVVPSNTKEVRPFLGVLNYHRNFVKNYADVMEPITRLLKKGQVFEWGERQEKAFSEVSNNA